MIQVKQDKQGSFVEGFIQIPVKAYVNEEITELTEEEAARYLDGEATEMFYNMLEIHVAEEYLQDAKIIVK